MNYSSVKELVLNKLKEELPKHLSYHNVKHTIDVIKSVERIGSLENIEPDDLLLLKTAALFHDTGFLFQRDDHETKSCEIAQEILPEYGYSQEQINRIKEIIEATRVPQSPQNLLGEIMADADLDYLGREDFFRIGEKLYDELKSVDLIKDRKEWNETQQSFLESHTYFTKSAKDLREKTKQKNLQIIKSKLIENQ